MFCELFDLIDSITMKSQGAHCRDIYNGLRKTEEEEKEEKRFKTKFFGGHTESYDTAEQQTKGLLKHLFETIDGIEDPKMSLLDALDSMGRIPVNQDSEIMKHVLRFDRDRIFTKEELLGKVPVWLNTILASDPNDPTGTYLQALDSLRVSDIRHLWLSNNA